MERLVVTGAKRLAKSDRDYPLVDFAAFVPLRAERFAAGAVFASTVAAFFRELPSPLLFANSDLFAA
jgi:hypothetical protein